MGPLTCIMVRTAHPVFYIILLVSSLSFMPSGQTQVPYQYDFNADCRKAYDEIIKLKLNTGKLLLETEKKAHPSNLIPYFLDNYIDFFTLFFNQDPDEFKLMKPSADQRLALMKKGDPASPFYLYTRSVIYFQWAAVDIKFGERLDAALSFRRSFLIGKENLEKFPDFQPTRMLQGSMQVAAGTIPPGYLWLSSLLGIHGTIDAGMKNLENMLNSKDPDAVIFHDEAAFYYLYLQFYILNQREQVFQYIQKQSWNTRNNHLFAYLVANLSLNNQDASVTEEIIRQLNRDPGYLEMPVWDMQMGYATADRLDPESIVYMDHFLSRFKGKFYVKDVLQKISWMYYLQHEPEKAEAVRARILVSGNTETEADKQALKEAESGRWPNETLLRARLLDDGGYYTQALQVLSGKQLSSFPDLQDKLEYSYRIGRIYDALGSKNEALAAYQEALRLGENRREYYGARAALQMGYIYESRGDKKNALSYFKKVLNMKSHDYKNALDQKAKAGIERCSEG
jgi:tetratricopeptide (TPR) repeat protein